MRTAVQIFGLAALAFCAFGAAGDARAGVEYPWCLEPSRFTVGNCYYSTLEQCMATASGNVGVCMRNPRYTAPTPGQRSRSRN
jgi:hypothetical protein